jgi:hypothetical protein
VLEWIVKTQDCPDDCCSQKNGVVSIGSGNHFAYGAVCAADKCSESPFDLDMTGVRAVAAWHPATSGPFLGWQISEAGKFTEFTEP